MKNLKRLLNLAIMVALISCEDQLSTTNFENEREDVYAENGVLHFKNKEVFTLKLNELNSIERADREIWEAQYSSFVSLRKIYDDVVKAEWEISNYYEEISKAGGEIPKAEVNSQKYVDALNNGSIKIIKDKNGDYFNFNLYELHYAPVVNSKGLVVVNDTIYQYTLNSVKIITDGNSELINKLDQFQVSSDENNIIVINYNNYSLDNARTKISTSWFHPCLPGHDWHFSGSRRWRVWIEGSSYLDGSFMYVTNLFRAEGQKKNFWGNWKFSETYCLDIDGTWAIQDVILGDYTSVTLPLASGVSNTPINYNSCSVNNASIPIYPHINGYYTSPGGSLARSFKDPVQIIGVNLQVVFGGVGMSIIY